MSNKYPGWNDQPAFEKLIPEYLQWVEDTFPGETADAQREHLDEEFEELIMSNHADPGEFADVLMLLICVANAEGIDIIQAFRDKFTVNKARTWEKTAKGFRHVK